MTRDPYDEVVRCPWCGARAYFDDIERPSDYCHHTEVYEPPGLDQPPAPTPA